jgi:hypothetical protein
MEAHPNHRSHFNTIIQMKAGHLRENTQTLQQQETPRTFKPSDETKK